MNPFRNRRFVSRAAFACKWLFRSLLVKEPLKAFGRPNGVDRDLIEAVYTINLDRQPARWSIFEGEAGRQRVAGGERLLAFCHRVPAVDGRTLDIDEACGLVDQTYPVDAQYFVDPDPRLLALIRDTQIPVAMSREEIAVALSHIKTWRSIVADDRAYALVLEDDVFFERQFASHINRAWQELPRNEKGAPAFDLLYLSFREVERGAQWVDYSPRLRRPARGYWWLSGYVLSNAGARKLLERLPVVGPVDLWMNHGFAELDAYSLQKSVIFQRNDLQSDNRYSILPLLSQIGVQSDTTHLLLEQTKGRRPVVCIGFGREQAAILETALGLLGYRCCNDAFGLHSVGIERVLEENLPLLFDAYIRVGSVTRQIARIEELHPEIAYIISAAADDDGELPATEFHAAKRDLLEREKPFLIFNARACSDWRSLCGFLRCETPRIPFPVDVATEIVTAPLPGVVKPTPLVERKMLVQEHDVHPWIVPYERLQAFGVFREARSHGTQRGIFGQEATEPFTSLDDARWTALVDSFPSNLAVFRRENVSVGNPGGCRLTLDNQGCGGRKFAGASLKSKGTYRYGRFEVILKAAKAPGVMTAFFLHRTDPWQEIDVELLGADTSKLLVNVYFNPGVSGSACNYGNRGTPVIIDLTFDASADYHRYSIEWEPHEVRWFVDHQLIHVRGAWEPTPIPNLPMELFASIWAPRSTELAGELVDSDLPVTSCARCIELCEWHSTPAPRRTGGARSVVATHESYATNFGGAR